MVRPLPAEPGKRPSWEARIRWATRKNLPPIDLGLPAEVQRNVAARERLGLFIAGLLDIEQVLPLDNDAARDMQHTAASEARRFELALVRFTKAMDRVGPSGLWMELLLAPPWTIPESEQESYFETLDAVPDVQYWIRRWTEAIQVFRRGQRRQKGRPRDRRAYKLAEETAVILADAGIRISKVRGSVLDNVLREMFRVASVPVPEDVYPYLRHAVDFVREHQRGLAARGV